jgi:amino acid transporter
MDDPAPPERDRLPSIKQILALLGAGVLLFPGLCMAIGLATNANGGGATIMIGLAVLAVVCTLVGALLLIVRGVRDFLRH